MAEKKRAFLRDVLQRFDYRRYGKTPSTFSEGKMFKGRQFDQSVVLLCVRWYLASHGLLGVKD